MQIYLQRWMAYPVFAEDAAKTRDAELLHVLSLSVLVLTVAIGLAGPFIFANPLFTTGIVWGLALLVVLVQVLMRRGYVREASALFLGAFWMLVMGVVLFSGGIRVTMSAFFVTVTVVAGLLLGARVGLSVAGLNMVVTLGLVYLESVNRIPPRFFKPPPLVAWVELAVNLALTGVALALTLRSLNTALSRAHESEQAAAAQAVEMREVNARLEHEIAEREASEIERERLLEEQTVLQQQVIEAQRQALRELSTPIIPVMDGILVMPLIGSIDDTRAKEILRAVLQGISGHRARVVILDVTGVPLMDTSVVNHLNKTIQAARLKGARVIVTGISDAVAEAIVDGDGASHGVGWRGVETLRDLQTGLGRAIHNLEGTVVTLAEGLLTEATQSSRF